LRYGAAATAEIKSNSANFEVMTMTTRYALLAYFAVVVAYVAYAAYSDSGLYRLAAEWQMQILGPTSYKMKFFVPVVILMIPGAVIERIMVSRGKQARR
jgi:hypothetical protein